MEIFAAAQEQPAPAWVIVIIGLALIIATVWALSRRK